MRFIDFILLLLALVFMEPGCKKEDHHLPIDSLAGEYAVSGYTLEYYRNHGFYVLDTTYTISNKPITLIKVDASTLEDIQDTLLLYGYQAQNSNDDYYIFSKGTDVLWDTLYFNKRNLGSIRIHRFENTGVFLLDSYFSGSKMP